MKAPRLTVRVLRAMEESLSLTQATPRGGDLPDEEDIGPEDSTDQDFENALAWVHKQLREKRK